MCKRKRWKREIGKMRGAAAVIAMRSYNIETTVFDNVATTQLKVFTVILNIKVCVVELSTYTGS